MPHANHFLLVGIHTHYAGASIRSFVHSGGHGSTAPTVVFHLRSSADRLVAGTRAPPLRFYPRIFLSVPLCPSWITRLTRFEQICH